MYIANANRNQILPDLGCVIIAVVCNSAKVRIPTINIKL